MFTISAFSAFSLILSFQLNEEDNINFDALIKLVDKVRYKGRPNKNCHCVGMD